jgi:hypothetical protein
MNLVVQYEEGQQMTHVTEKPENIHMDPHGASIIACPECLACAPASITLTLHRARRWQARPQHTPLVAMQSDARVIISACLLWHSC